MTTDKKTETDTPEPFRRYGRTMFIIEQFRTLPDKEMCVFCADKSSAKALKERLRFHMWLKARVSEDTHYGQPITMIQDEFSDNPKMTTIPNEMKSYSVRLIKLEEKGGES